MFINISFTKNPRIIKQFFYFSFSHMKKKELEILLQKVPIYEYPNPYIEQYMTSANIAADIIFNAFALEDIQDKTILDLGCGTGVFSYAAKLAGAEKVIGIDIDKEVIKIAKNFAKTQNVEINYYDKNVKDVDCECDTVIMNPPFGAQKSNRWADRGFIEKAFELSNVTYSLHLTKTTDFIEKIVAALDGEITHMKNYIFPIKNTYFFHTKKSVDCDVTLFRILTKK